MFARVVKKVHEIGLKNCLTICKNRLGNFFIEKNLRKKSQNNSLNFLFEDFKNSLKIKDFDSFFLAIRSKNLSFVEKYLADFKDFDIKIANDLLNDEHEVLGFGKLKKTSWFCDVTCNEYFDNFSFYKDIKIETGNSQNLKKDIKVPWHFSRFHHATTLSLAYVFTNDIKFIKKAQSEIEDWIEKNPYLTGINWLCAMEVAIRAVNWIFFFYFARECKEIKNAFWQKFFAILYCHWDYLRNNWEIYDTKTNNHYLSNLLGFFYLSYFFGFEKEFKWCFEEFLKEIDKQIFDEGTSYEGSTSYHGLVTEIFYHFILLARQTNLEIEQKYLDKFEAMQKFFSDAESVKIGDDDSGQIVLGLKLKNKMSSLKLYKDFGLSIAYSGNYHLTLRHHSFKKFQSSGHFHNDISSITLSLQDIPVIVDPGSYVYTSSSYWRNYFRSANQHNGLFIEGLEPVELTDNLFFLKLPANKNSDVPFEANNFCYGNLGLQAKRKIEFTDPTSIQDSWINLKSESQKFISCWNFTFAPDIELQKRDNTWLIFYKNNLLGQLYSDLNFEQTEGFCSTRYGKLEKCYRLVARREILLRSVETVGFKLTFRFR